MKTSDFHLHPLSTSPSSLPISASQTMRCMWTCGLPFSFPHKLSACLSELILAKPSGIRKYSFVGSISSLGESQEVSGLHTSSCLPPPSSPLRITPVSSIFLLLAKDVRSGAFHTPLRVDCCLQVSFRQTCALECLEVNREGRLPHCCVS